MFQMQITFYKLINTQGNIAFCQIDFLNFCVVEIASFNHTIVHWLFALHTVSRGQNWDSIEVIDFLDLDTLKLVTNLKYRVGDSFSFLFSFIFSINFLFFLFLSCLSLVKETFKAIFL